MQVVGKKAGAGALTAEMLKNPALMQALQGKLDGIIGTPSGYIEVRTNSLNEAHLPLLSLLTSDECQFGSDTSYLSSEHADSFDSDINLPALI